MEEATKDILKSADNLESVGFKDTFKVGDVEFENEKLKALPDPVKMQRARLLWALNVTISKAMPFWNHQLNNFEGTLT